MADQAMYHQENQSVFVGGGLWTLLPPPAIIRSLTSVQTCHTHTHPTEVGKAEVEAKLRPRQ